ncbi:hypothetical protein L1857_23155 [Amycolatopsis thermalba]|uniref:Uncharacterized protein n=1 Tax=Amycolatopsis thermalba TaxID=944492 RepID=A0ABY4NZS0_9PSEU|nr:MULTISPECIES: hypothetical protein [Amycolatopsis]UQS25502.1 hypothetical protein L1857_23155 [Amycolatopsis thermalba]
MQPEAAAVRLSGMRMLPVVALGIAVLTACGASEGAAGGRACTMIGAVPGISLDVEPRPGRTVAAATVTVCRDGACRTGETPVFPATTPGPQTCTGTGPEDSCSVELRETGGWYGFVPIHDLREGPYEVTVVLTNASGGEVGRTTQNTAAQLVYPNGPECGGGVPQATVAV